MMFIIATFHFMIRAITYYTLYNLEGWRSMLRVLKCFFFFFFFFFRASVCFAFYRLFILPHKHSSPIGSVYMPHNIISMFKICITSIHPL